MDVEAAFSIVGKFGKFQFFCFLIFGFSQMIMAFQIVLMSMVGAAPEVVTNTRGKIETLDSNTIISEWSLSKDSQVASMVQSATMLGILFGNLLFGQLADTYGRKAVFSKVMPLFIFSSFLTTFANNPAVLAVIRFFVGFFVGGVGLISFVHCQELLDSSIWTISGCVLPAFFAVGIAVLAGISSQVYDWRNVCIATSLPGVLLCLAYIAVPESPRWLYSRGNIDRAQYVMKYLAEHNGNSSHDLVLKQKVDRDERKTRAKKKDSHGLMSLFTTARTLAVRTLVMGFVWFTCSFVYYGLTMNAGNLSSDRYTSLALVGLVEIPALVLCNYLIDRPWAGRKRSLIGSFLVAGIACAGVMFTDTVDAVSGVEDDADDQAAAAGGSSGNSKLVLALVGKLAIAFAFTDIYIYASELFPTVVRNVGMGSSSMCARIGGILAPLVPTLASISPPLPYLVFSACCFVAVCTCLLIPETLNTPIPDTIGDLDDYKPNDDLMRSSRKYDRLPTTIDDDDDDDGDEIQLLSADSGSSRSLAAAASSASQSV